MKFTVKLVKFKTISRANKMPEPKSLKLRELAPLEYQALNLLH